jgi:DNA invertase Pin-like site-specific DNA recombinase
VYTRGLAGRKAKGYLRGKHPKLTVNQAKHLVELADLGSYSTAELAELFGVSRSTVYRTLLRVRPLPADPNRPFASKPA